VSDDAVKADDRPTGLPGGVAGVLQQEAPLIEAEYTGLLRRGRNEGEVSGFLYCAAERIRVEFRGHKDARTGKGYFIYGQRIRLQGEMDV